MWANPQCHRYILGSVLWNHRSQAVRSGFSEHPFHCPMMTALNAVGEEFAQEVRLADWRLGEHLLNFYALY